MGKRSGPAAVRKSRFAGFTISEGRRDDVAQNVVIEIDTDEALAYAREKLAGIKDSRIRMAVRTAINHTARDAKKADEKAAKSIYTDPGHLNEFAFKRASVGDLVAVLKDKGSAVRMDYFKVRAGKTVTSALINKNRGYKKLYKYGNKAFVNPPPRVRVRLGKSRYPVETFYSLSSPSAHGSPDTQEASGLEEIGTARFYEYLDEEISKILGF